MFKYSITLPNDIRQVRLIDVERELMVLRHMVRSDLDLHVHVTQTICRPERNPEIRLQWLNSRFTSQMLIKVSTRFPEMLDIHGCNDCARDPDTRALRPAMRSDTEPVAVPTIAALWEFASIDPKLKARHFERRLPQRCHGLVGYHCYRIRPIDTDFR